MSYYTMQVQVWRSDSKKGGIGKIIIIIHILLTLATSALQIL